MCPFCLLEFGEMEFPLDLTSSSLRTNVETHRLLGTFHIETTTWAADQSPFHMQMSRNESTNGRIILCWYGKFLSLLLGRTARVKDKRSLTLGGRITFEAKSGIVSDAALQGVPKTDRLQPESL